jgi:hypothetical protein
LAATLLSAIVTCVAALFLGQAALRLAGAREWSWLAPPVGISIGMLVAVPAIHLPGRCAGVAALLGALTIAAVIWCIRAPAHRPPLSGLLAAAPIALLVLVPYLAAGRAGILGTSINNDMAAHLWFVEAYMSEAVAAVTPLPLDYPLGPHAMVAVIAKGFGIRADQAFAGWMMALPLLNAWTVLALVRRAPWLGRVVAATVVGMPFLIAAYYGQGAFKEVLLAGLVLAMALSLSGCGPALGRGRWVPFALLVAGTVSVYSVTGLPWPLLLGGLWLAGVLALRVVRRGFGGLWSSVRRELPALGIGLAVLTISLIPQLPRLERFVSLRSGTNGTGIPKEDLGNLIGPLPGWEAFGVWNNPDFRLPASPAFTGGMWTALALALALIGVVWALRRGRWMLPLAAAGSMLIWAVSAHSQSPYVAAKALVVASPLLLALAMLPLVERGVRRPPWWTMIAPLLALVLFLRVGVSDVRALRISPVGPTSHLSELRTLWPLLDGRPTLFLGDDDYIRWELPGVPLGAPVLYAVQQLPIRPQKAWSYGKALDFDSVDAATLNAYDFVITTRDAAGSAPPPQLHLVASTDDYALWRRLGKVEERSVLAEGDAAGAVLDCRAGAGRAAVQAGGVAAVRSPSLVTPAPSVAPGGTASVQLQLRPGTWELQTPYTSSLPIAVTAPDLRTTLPANLDRPGPRWPLGRIVVRDRRPVAVSFHVEDTAFAPASAVAALGSLIATPRAAERIVPLRRACGRYVDWYRAAKPSASTAGVP